MKIYNLSQCPICLVLKLGIKTNPKQNVLSGFNLLSRDSVSQIHYEIHMRNISHATLSYDVAVIQLKPSCYK